MVRAGGAQSRALMREKEELARLLLGRGLTVRQVSGQLRCSQPFVRRIARDLGCGAERRGAGVQQGPRPECG
jgi:hypothetical protein